MGRGDVLLLIFRSIDRSRGDGDVHRFVQWPWRCILASNCRSRGVEWRQCIVIDNNAVRVIMTITTVMNIRN